MDARETAPSPERNKQPILEVLARVLPPRGLVLEIGSGTGQHVAHFAKALPALTFQPREYEAVDRSPGPGGILDGRQRGPIRRNEGPWPGGFAGLPAAERRRAEQDAGQQERSAREDSVRENGYRCFHR